MEGPQVAGQMSISMQGLLLEASKQRQTNYFKELNSRAEHEEMTVLNKSVRCVSLVSH